MARRRRQAWRMHEGELADVYRANQQDIGVAFELSILLYRDNQKDLSLAVMEEVVNRDAGNVNAKWYLAAMYEERNRLDEALVLLNDLAGPAFGFGGVALLQFNQGHQHLGRQVVGLRAQGLVQTIEGTGQVLGLNLRASNGDLSRRFEASAPGGVAQGVAGAGQVVVGQLS